MISQTGLNIAKNTIERLLNITADEHNAMIFEFGMLYLERLFIQGSVQYIKLSRDKQFWNWWTNQWHIHNYEVLLMLGFDLTEQQISNIELAALREAFNAKHKACDIFPTKKLVYEY